MSTFTAIYHGKNFVFWWNEDINIVLNVSAFNKQVELPPLVHVKNFFQGVLEIGNHI